MKNTYLYCFKCGEKFYPKHGEYKSFEDLNVRPKCNRCKSIAKGLYNPDKKSKRIKHNQPYKWCVSECKKCIEKYECKLRTMKCTKCAKNFKQKNLLPRPRTDEQWKGLVCATCFRVLNNKQKRREFQEERTRLKQDIRARNLNESCER